MAIEGVGIDYVPEMKRLGAEETEKEKGEESGEKPSALTSGRPRRRPRA